MCLSRLTILPNIKQTIKEFPKTLKKLPMWQNFAQSGHTAREGSCFIMKGAAAPRQRKR